jgi:coenzyme F420-reducing hydrogenase beta subunit
MGWVQDTYVGRLADKSERMQAPSGGVTTAVLLALLQRGEIDAAIVAKPVKTRPWYQMTVAETPEEILASRGSVYHVVDFAETLREVIQGPERRYAVVGLPCAVKAIRLAQRRIPKLKRRLSYVLGLTCGGHRSRCFTDLLVGLTGSDNGFLRFRSKQYARQANDFAFTVETGNSKKQIRFLGLFGFLWLNGVGELKSCLFCDDIFAELADGNFMDAWLPEYMHDPSGMNLVISRSPKLSSVLENLFALGICDGQHLPPAKVEDSQLGVIDKKRSDLPARIKVAACSGWTPEKRFGKPTANTPCATQPATAQLQRWEILRRYLAGKTVHLSNSRGLAARILAWQACLGIYGFLRRLGLPIYNWRAVFFVQRFHPRAMIRGLVLRVVRR